MISRTIQHGYHVQRPGMVASHRLARTTGSDHKRSFFAARWQSALYSVGVSYCCCVVLFLLGELVWISGQDRSRVENQHGPMLLAHRIRGDAHKLFHIRGSLSLGCFLAIIRASYRCTLAGRSQNRIEKNFIRQSPRPRFRRSG
jgi:hypothetical protein